MHGLWKTFLRKIFFPANKHMRPNAHGHDDLLRFICLLEERSWVKMVDKDLVYLLVITGMRRDPYNYSSFFSSCHGSNLHQRKCI